MLLRKVDENVSTETQNFPRYIRDVSSAKKIDLRAWQAANIRYSYLLGLFVFVLFALIAYLTSLALSPGSALLFIFAALVLAGIHNWVAYWFSDRIALNIAGAKPASPAEERYLVNISEAISFGTGLPQPKIYVIDSSQPNAFATGRNPQHSSIAVSKGLLDLLDRQELEGVIAHEMSHIKNYDILFMTMLSATIGAFIILRDLILRNLRYGSRKSNRSDKGQIESVAYLLLIVLLIVSPILGTLLHLAISRRREFLADASAVYLTRNPDGLISALKKISSFQPSEPVEVNEGIRHLYFADPKSFGRQLKGLFATHPPIEERIDRLKRL